MSIEMDTAYIRANYSILPLVWEAQRRLGYTHGLVDVTREMDQKIRCPVHHDRTPSAKVISESGRVYCWVCQESWDYIGLYQVMHECTFIEAVRAILAQSGIAMSRHRPEAKLAEKQEPAGISGEGWAEQVWLWADRYLGECPALDEVRETCVIMGEAERAGMEASVQAAVRWACALHPALPEPPIVSDSLTRFLLE